MWGVVTCVGSRAMMHRDVRLAVLSNVCITNGTLPCILKRSRDVKDEVRRLTFATIAEKVELRQLSISQRVALLQDGLNDRYVTGLGATTGAASALTTAVKQCCRSEDRVLEPGVHLAAKPQLRLGAGGLLSAPRGSGAQL